MMTLTSTQIGQLAAQFFLAGAGTLSFAVLFACPRRTLPAVRWWRGGLVRLRAGCLIRGRRGGSLPHRSHPADAGVPLFAILLKTPVTVFLLTGIFPLVPGAGIYYTAYYFIQGENAFRWPTASPPSRSP